MSRYSSSNLTEFEFHDAWAEEVHWEGDVLTCRVKQCSLHANALENPYSQDMELSEAVLTFSGFQIKEYCLPGWKESFPNGKAEVHPEQRFVGTEAKQRFSQAAAEGLWLKDISAGDPTKSTLEACGRTEPYFSVTFSFRQVLVEWESFAGPAWQVNFRSDS